MFKPKFRYTFDGAVKAMTQHRCLEVCRLTIFASLCKKMLRLLPKIEGFGGIPGPKEYQIKNSSNSDACAVIYSLSKVKFS